MPHLHTEALQRAGVPPGCGRGFTLTLTLSLRGGGKYGQGNIVADTAMTEVKIEIK